MSVLRYVFFGMIALQPLYSCAQENPDNLAELASESSDSPLPSVTVSVLKNFEIHGKTAELRTEVARLAEEVMQELLVELKEKPDSGQKSVTIQVQLAGDSNKKGVGLPYRKSYGSSPIGGFYVKLLVDVSRLDRQGLRAALVESILYQRTLIEVGLKGGNQKLNSHPWLVDGLLEVADWRQRRADLQQYELLAKMPKLFELDRIFDMTREQIAELDKASFRSYRAACGSFVLALLNQKKGAEHFKKLLNEAALFHGDDRNLLKQHFPDLNKGKHGVRVAWLLQLAQMGVAKMTDILTILETEKMLNLALEFRLMEKDGALLSYSLEDFEKLANLEESSRRLLFSSTAAKLVQLENRCFPLYKEILYSYGTVINALSHGSVKGVAPVVSRLAEERKLMLDAAERARDYLDWYTIQNASDVKADFSALKMSPVPVAKNRDVLGKYLDLIDSFYAK